MNVEQQKILDRLCLIYLEKKTRHEKVVAALAVAERDLIVSESKFKGVIEAFGGEDWQYDGKHVRFLPEQSAKIPRESKK